MPPPDLDLIRQRYGYACGYCGVTKTGRFHITLLRLNRPQLIKHRLSQQVQDVLQGKLALLEQQIHEMQETITAQERYISALEDLLG